MLDTRVVVILTTFLFASCNSVFYYPDALKYGDPNSLGYITKHDRVPSANGNLLDVISFNAVNQTRGTVVHFHGNAQNLTSHLRFSYWLPEEGYNLVVFDYQGYGKSEGTPSREGTLQDGVAVLNYVKKMYPNVPLFVLGQSLGGAVGYVSSSLVAERPCGMIIESSFASYRGVVRTKLSKNMFTWALQWPLSFLVSDSFSPRDYGQKFLAPVLFIHGTADPVVPFSEGEEFYAVHQGPKEWNAIPKGGHISAFAFEESPYRKIALDFLNRSSSLCRADQ